MKVSTLIVIANSASLVLGIVGKVDNSTPFTPGEKAIVNILLKLLLINLLGSSVRDYLLGELKIHQQVLG
jgi:hypothetical protein